MTRIIFVSHAGQERIIDAENGMSVMEAAVWNGVDGIVAECGGACACATCHVYIAEHFHHLTGEPEAMEAAMLEMVDNRRASSRLSCQIRIRDELDGLCVTTPESQI